METWSLKKIIEGSSVRVVRLTIKKKSRYKITKYGNLDCDTDYWGKNILLHE